jgi:hypothetical protein
MKNSSPDPDFSKCPVCLSSSFLDLKTSLRLVKSDNKVMIQFIPVFVGWLAAG